jgi:hypothetical protein
LSVAGSSFATNQAPPLLARHLLLCGTSDDGEENRLEQRFQASPSKEGDNLAAAVGRLSLGVPPQLTDLGSGKKSRNPQEEEQQNVNILSH